jgi:hypothetical protein
VGGKHRPHRPPLEGIAATTSDFLDSRGGRSPGTMFSRNRLRPSPVIVPTRHYESRPNVTVRPMGDGGDDPSRPLSGRRFGRDRSLMPQGSRIALRLTLSEFAVRVREVSRKRLLAGETGQTVVAKGADVLPWVGHG